MNFHRKLLAVDSLCRSETDITIIHYNSRDGFQQMLISSLIEDNPPCASKVRFSLTVSPRHLMMLNLNM